MKVTTLEQFENGIGRVATKLNQYASKTELAGKLDSTGKAETAGTADNAIRDGEGNIIANTYLKKSDNVTVDLSDYQTAAQADAKYLGKTDTAANSEKATKDGQGRNIADTYITKDEASSTYLEKTALNVISAVPSQSGSVTYDGTAKTPSWLNYDPLKLQISGDYQNKINAGTYQTGFKPISIYTWSNGTQDIQYTTWTIGKAAGRLSLSAESGSVNIDSTTTFTVNRAGDGAITVTSSNSNIATAAVSGNTVTITGKAVGSATITVKVAEGTNHFAPADKTFNVTVNKIPLNLSASISSAVTYNLTGTINISGNTGGGAVTATSANSSCVTVSSTTTSTVTVKCANYSAAATQITINVAETTKYTSGTTTCNVTTAKAAGSVTLSATSGTATYGTPITFTVKSNLSGGTLSVTSSNSNCVTASISGSTVTVTPVNCSQASQTITVKSAETNNYNETNTTYAVTLARAAGTLSIDKTSINLTVGTPQDTVTITTNSNGTITATPANTAVCSTTVSGKTVTFKRNSNGETTVTIAIEQSDQYTAPTAKNITVAISITPINMLENFTLAQLKTIFRNGQGSNYFKADDYFDITFPSTITLRDTNEKTIDANSTYRVVCLGINHNLGKEGNNRGHFCIGKNTNNKDICFDHRQINSTQTSSGGWAESEIKTWLNETFYNALPTDLKNVITECTKYTDNTGGTSNVSDNVTGTIQKIWLMAEFEIFGSRTNANVYEQYSQEQYDYYKNGNSKYRYSHISESSIIWHQRSPSVKYNKYFCRVASGRADNYLSDGWGGIVPCFTIS